MSDEAHSESVPSTGPSVYLLARTREGQAWEALRVYGDLITAADVAIALSEAEPKAVFRVVANGRRTVLLATKGLGRWVRPMAR
jgi:hypothetical protein